MPGWGEILGELAATRLPGGSPDYDGVRRRYLAQLYALTGRPVIIYYSGFLSRSTPEDGIELGDVTGLMETCRGLPEGPLDLLLHSPGGSPEATAALVAYLRQKFTDIRIFVPQVAMSAATMWSMAGDEIWMGKHSQLGPIDPQFVIGGRMCPARGILDQFERAKREIAADPRVLGAWVPMLAQYGPSLLEQCEKAERLSRTLVAKWLSEYMLKDVPNRGRKARRIAVWLESHQTHQSHSMPINRETLRAKGVKVRHLEDDGPLQDAVLSVHHACLHTFNGPAFKIIENHLGRAYVRIAPQVQMPIQLIPQLPPGLPGIPPNP